MGFLIASLITLAVLGSVMWVMPSVREKSLITMRNKALSLGLKVRLVDEKLSKALFPWLDNYRGYTLYEKLLPSGKKPNSFRAKVIRVSDDQGVHEIDAVDPLRQLLMSHNLFEDLPSSVEALVISASGIALSVALLQMQTFLIGISIPILIVTPYLMARKLRNPDGSCKINFKN